MPQSYSASANGSLILMGEYAVLRGYPCLVAAIDKTLTVTVKLRQDCQLNIHSTLGNLHTTVNTITVAPPFEYVLSALKQLDFSTGLDIHIDSQFSSQLGLGSSAAVTAALISALWRAQQKTFSRSDLFHSALKVIHSVQGRGSGADVAASIYGGIIEYQISPLRIQSLKNRPQLIALYSGKKTTTTQALTNFASKEQQHPKVLTTYLRRLGQLSQDALDCFKSANWPELGQLMNQAQQQLKQLGVSTTKINALITKLHNDETILGAKISGSGLGDCVIALGKLSQRTTLNPLAISIGIDRH